MLLIPARSPALCDSEAEDAPTVALGMIPPPPSDIACTPPPVSNLAASSITATPPALETVTMPQPGDDFFGFKLKEELGHGTFARVFLATQDALAGRKVALKVTLKPTREPERIAQLQHTNVVPVYSVHNAAPVQIICMPFLGRRTLADILLGYRKSQVAPGHSTRKAIATKKGSSVAGSRSKTGFRLPVVPASIATVSTVAEPDTNPLVGNSGPVLQILKQLADGLAHAHERGVLHLDLKPANVLIADTGEPMLLDFNLSFASFEGNREVVGGTIPYMAPEQLLDLQTRGKGEVDARTDLYSLGVMAFELLAGKHPFPVTSRTLSEFEGLIASRMKGPSSLRDFNQDISPAVEAIVRKLLEPKPENRYQCANDLREDLDRQLADRPLQFAADRSVVERVGKWRRRNPKALVAMLLAAVLSVAGGTGAYAFQENEKRAVGEAEARVRSTKEGLETLRLDLVLPNDSAARASGSQKAIALLKEYGLPNDPDWRKKPAFQRVPEAQRAALAGDLGELLLLLAHARWEDGKTADRPDAARDALQLNQLAAGCFGDSPPPFLVRQKAELDAAIANQPVEKIALKAASGPRELFLEATASIAAGHFSSAIKQLEKVVLAAPDHGAAHFCLAYSRHQLGQYTRAIERYETARSLLPKDPRPPFYCGIAHGLGVKTGGASAAEESFTQAIEIDEKRGDSYRNRAVARMELRRWEDAEEDLTAALEKGASKFQIYTLRIKVREKRGDEDGAAGDRKAMKELSPELDLDYLTRGFAQLPADPKSALRNYRLAGEKNPRSLSALQNQAYVLSNYLNDPAGAFKVLDRLVELYPEYGPARACRAMLLAQMGKREEAHREADLAGKFSDDPGVTYRRACAYAITSKTNVEDRKKAFGLLKQAFRDGFHNVQAYESDANLQPLRDLPEFKELLKSVNGLL